jgi:hypothetical protein
VKEFYLCAYTTNSLKTNFNSQRITALVCGYEKIEKVGGPDLIDMGTLPK